MGKQFKIKTPMIYSLEQRLLFDGAVGAEAAAAIVYRDGNDETPAPALAPETQREKFQADTPNNPQSIVFIDGGLSDRQTLIDAVPDGTEVYILDTTADGYQQITDILQNRQNIDSIHIFGHGAAGEAKLGTASLSLDTLHIYEDTFNVLKNALSEQGDILLYGCNVADQASGQTLIQELAELTAADIAASDDITGRDGDWDLEARTGPIEAEIIAPETYRDNLNTDPPSITSGATGTALSENTEVTTSTAVYTATGTYDETPITWSLKTDVDDEGLFDIDSSTGAVTFKTATTPDYETKSNYSFTVIATSGSLAPVEQSVTIAVTPVNDAPDLLIEGNQTISDSISNVAPAATATTTATQIWGRADGGSSPATYNSDDAVFATIRDAQLSYLVDGSKSSLRSAASSSWAFATLRFAGPLKTDKRL